MTRLEPESHDSQSGPPGGAADDHEELRFCVGQCPICDGGLCTVRVFFDDTGPDSTSEQISHGLVACDECEAIWLQPNTRGVHVYANSETPLCPVSGKPLYDNRFSRWANAADVASLGWSDAIDPALTHDPRGDRSDA
ncbi:hypothetical protein [Aporhodopirellula aestuarii]|uniref:Transcription factor zinc-finger domain-containing protein n=1 Tax=Aporhodopirellula aestuarii TaxID=2950107 RepID=A0ABT0U7I8_9BACT|nr:hypothetical protein [Aporhodopirellula aestuarii]MCM2372383.1 hypothetical protein [Aporhodopirellula aestuarii]